MKLCVSSYSYSRLVGSGKMSMLDVPAKAKEMGFDGLEFSEFASPDGRPLEEYAAELRAAAEKAGIPLVNYAVGADLLTGGDEGIEAGMALLKRKVDVAAILGAPGMRHDITYSIKPGESGLHTFEAALPRIAKGVRAVTEYAASKGIRTMTENHGYISQDSVRIEKLLTAVNNPNFGVLLDLGNFYCVDEDSAQAVGRLAPYAFHAHAKDFHMKSGNGFPPGEGWFMSRGGNYLRGAIIGHGNVPLLQAIRALKRAGYDGVLSVEFEGIEDPRVGVRIGQANLRKLVELA